ncbi:MAG: hypothetical protein OXD45_02430 [Rhodobacteraceae bacterium]|nr:hypothetical protein [Paracoccaceae bacterium]
MPANAMAPSMPMVHMVMVACRRFMIPRQSGKVLSRCLDGEVHLKFRGRPTKRVQHVPARAWTTAFPTCSPGPRHPTGKGALISSWQWEHAQPWAMWSTTTMGDGFGMSWTRLLSTGYDIPSTSAWTQWVQLEGKWFTTWSGTSERRRVFPFQPFKPRRRSRPDINSARLAMVCSNSTQTSSNSCS